MKVLVRKKKLELISKNPFAVASQFVFNQQVLQLLEKKYNTKLPYIWTFFFLCQT